MSSVCAFVVKEYPESKESFTVKAVALFSSNAVTAYARNNFSKKWHF